MPYLAVLNQGLLLTVFQASLIAVLRGPHVVPGIERGSAASKANTLHAVLSLWSKKECFMTLETFFSGQQDDYCNGLSACSL